MSPAAPGAQPPSDPATAGAEGSSAAAAAAAGPHNFSVQKQVHSQIRNDPDYDDWEYGTEPLPQESWRSVTPPPTPSGAATDPSAASSSPPASSPADPAGGRA